MVDVAKGLISRALAAGTDPQLAMQAYRATPFQAHVPSPAEMFLGRKIRTGIPTRTLLTQKQQDIREVEINSKLRQQQYYDQHARENAELQQFQPVYVQLDPNKRSWQHATVIKTPSDKAPRTYLVQTSQGAQYERNRRFLRPAVQPQPVPATLARNKQPSSVPPVLMPATVQQNPTADRTNLQNQPTSPQRSPSVPNTPSSQPTTRPVRSNKGIPAPRWADESQSSRYK